MVASIKTNIPAQYAAANLRSSIESSQRAAIRLSSGNQITKASDDAAGLSIGTGLKTNVDTLKAANKGASQATSILSITDGILGNISDSLGRLRALASSANSGAMGTNELTYIKSEMDALIAEITRVAGNTQFNGSTLLDGTYTSKAFQVGVQSTDTISVSFSNDMQSTALGINAIDVTSDVAGALTALDTAINTVKTERATVGALQSRFSSAAANIEISTINTDAARADYLDADIAEQSTVFAGDSTKIQAGVAVLAQVNQLPQNLLKLLG